MKMYELHEAFSGGLDGFEIFFKNARSGSVFFLHFASYPSYLWICEAVERVLSRFSVYFMKIMKMYEGGVFNGFFGIGSLFPAQDMKLKNGSASWKFINSDPSPSPSPNSSHPERGSSEMLFCYGWEYFGTSDGVRYRRAMVYKPSAWSDEDRKAARLHVVILQAVILVNVLICCAVVFLAFVGGV